jgi:predicted metal-dependent enzyme (double-stranded beta helix superfamily)
MLRLSQPEDTMIVRLAQWPPGKASPIHDHAGILVVDAVLRGSVVETRYEALPEHDELLLRALCRRNLVAGDLTSFREADADVAHMIENASREPAVTLHVYAAALSGARIFRPNARGNFSVELVK